MSLAIFPPGVTVRALGDVVQGAWQAQAKQVRPRLAAILNLDDGATDDLGHLTRIALSAAHKGFQRWVKKAPKKAEAATRALEGQALELGFDAPACVAELARDWAEVRAGDDPLARLAQHLKAVEARLRDDLGKTDVSRETAARAQLLGPAVWYYLRDGWRHAFLDRNGDAMGLDAQALRAAATGAAKAVKAGRGVGLDETSTAAVAALVSVLVEAIGDVLFEVPFYPPDSDPTCKRAKVITTPVTWPPPPDGSQPDHDWAPLIGELVRTAARATSRQTRAAAGSAVRSGSWAALNNEALAEAVAAALATAAKKCAEALAYHVLVELIKDPDWGISGSCPWVPGPLTKDKLLEWLEKELVG